MSLMSQDEYLRKYEPKYASPREFTQLDALAAHQREERKVWAEERRKDEEWRRKHPILAALFG